MSAFARATSPSASLAAQAASLSLQASGIALPSDGGQVAAAAAVSGAVRVSSHVVAGPAGVGPDGSLQITTDSLRDAAMRDASTIEERQRDLAGKAAIDTFGAALARCSSFTEIVGLIPEPYRDTMRPLLSRYHALAQKLEQSDDEQRKWANFSTENLDVSWPDCVPKPVLPNLQLKKEAADKATELQGRLKAARAVYVKACLRDIVAARDAEILAIKALIEPGHISGEIGRALVSRFRVLSQRLHEGLDLQEWFEGMSERGLSDEGFAAERLLRELQGGDANTYWRTHPGRRAGLHTACLIYDEVNAIALPTAIATIQLVRVQALRASDAKDRKRALKDQSRQHVAMDIDQVGDARREVLSNEQRAAIGDMLSRQVNKQLARLGGRHAQVNFTNLPQFMVWVLTGIDPSRLATRPESQETSRRHPNQKGQVTPRQSGEEGQSRPSRKTRESQRSGPAFWKRQGRPKQLQGQGQEPESAQAQVGLVSTILADSSWKWDDSDSYPDSILNIMDSDVASRLLCTRIPTHVQTSLLHQNVIHIGPGVHFDYAHSLELSAGLKYMFENKFSRQLVREAYSDWTRRAGWKLHFLQEKAKDQRDEFIALFNHKPPSDKWIFHLDEAWNRGLEEGWKYVYEFDEAVPHDDDMKRESVSRKRVKSYLECNNYLLLMTDKNLGCALVTRDWYIHHTRLFLINTPQFVDRTAEQWYEAREQTYSELHRFATDFKDVLDDINKMVYSFILSKADEARTANPPDFKGLPKIHKNPWAFRPIIPCHSVAQAPLGTFLSWYLKPLVNQMPTILNGSKELSIRLTDLNSTVLANRPILSGRSLFFVTGDITAFYTNVNRRDVEHSVLKLWGNTVRKGRCHEYERVLQFREPDKYNRMLKEALRIAGQNLYYVFDNQFGEQSEGLAMGVPHSPDLANIFGFDREKGPVSELAEEGHLLFFGRYIDDAILIVEADNAEEALGYARRISYAPCHIGWEVQTSGCVFLDMHMWFNPGPEKTMQVAFAPYRKALNHLERIPWNSAHPFDVKRGTFYGELSRIAVLSSEWSTYCSAVKECVMIYQSRGYPTTNLMNWIDAKLSSCWVERHAPSRKSQPKGLLWVLKSRFNPAWEHFNVQVLRDRIVTQWLESTQDSVQQCVQGRFIVSRKATFQMRDMVNALNKKIISMGPDDI